MKRTITIELDQDQWMPRCSSVAGELIEVIKANRYLAGIVTGLRYTEQGDTVRTVPGTFGRKNAALLEYWDIIPVHILEAP